MGHVGLNSEKRCNQQHQVTTGWYLHYRARGRNTLIFLIKIIVFDSFYKAVLDKLSSVITLNSVYYELFKVMYRNLASSTRPSWGGCHQTVPGRAGKNGKNRRHVRGFERTLVINQLLLTSVYTVVCSSPRSQSSLFDVVTSVHQEKTYLALLKKFSGCNNDSCGGAVCAFALTTLRW